jgi:hypothetical protein
MIKLKDILLEQTSELELSGKEKDRIFNAVLQYTLFNHGHYNRKQSKIKFSDGSMWEVPKSRSDLDDTTITLTNLASGKTEYVNHATSKNQRPNWSYVVQNKKGEYEYPKLGWPEEIYGGYLGQSLVLDPVWNSSEGNGAFWPKRTFGKWTDAVVWTRKGGLSPAFVNNKPNNPWDCRYDKFKLYADNQKSDEYPYGIWEPLKARAIEANYDLDPNKCK